jgi:ADP-heptose:LPS heptosyltransferase
MSRVYVAPVSFGLGDLVVSLPVIQALIAQGRHDGTETWLVARSDTQGQLAGRIAGLTGWLDAESFDRDFHVGRFVDLRDHPLQRDYWWGSPEFEDAFGNLAINDILSRICADFDIAADFTRPIPLTARPRVEYRSSVLLVTESDGPTKHWSVDSWMLLSDSVRARGLDVRLVTREEAAPEMRVLGVADARAPSPGDAVDVLSGAAAVIGIDTGLTHLAVQQATPTVTIFHTPAIFFRPWPNARAVLGDRCADACIASEKERAYNTVVDLRGLRWRPQTCAVARSCIDGVEPEDVVRTLDSVL